MCVCVCVCVRVCVCERVSVCLCLSHILLILLLLFNKLLMINLFKIASNKNSMKTTKVIEYKYID